jgi:hypothetical protein
MTGTYVLSAGYYDAYYLQGAEGPHADRADFARAFEQVDLLAGRRRRRRRSTSARRPTTRSRCT